MIQNELLVDKKGLLDLYPVFNKWSLEWLIRSRRIPIVKIGRKIFFDTKDIKNWIDEHKIMPYKEVNYEKRLYKI